MSYANPFADPATQPPPGMTPDELKRWYLNFNPDAGYTSYLQGRSLYGMDPVAQYAQRRQQHEYNRYLSAASDNPLLGFYDFLLRNPADFESEYKGQSRAARGDFTDRSLTPRTRWVV